MNEPGSAAHQIRAALLSVDAGLDLADPANAKRIAAIQSIAAAYNQAVTGEPMSAQRREALLSLPAGIKQLCLYLSV